VLLDATRTIRFHCATFAAWALALSLAACSDDGDATDGGLDASADTDPDADVDAGTGTDSDSDSDTDGDGGTPMTPADYGSPTALTWALLDGGTFLQGSESSLSPASYSETPAHEVTVPTFEMMITEVTTSQYAQCVLADICAEPFAAIEGDSVLSNCNWLWWGRDDHPVNCVNVEEAENYCAWIDARLPSESEWEFAARCRGEDNEYPWGDEEASCDLAVMRIPYVEEGCGTGHTWPVCSKAAGNTEQDLCDMAGNVQEWVQDCWYGDYYGAPADGSAWVMGPCEDNVLRGGGYGNGDTGIRTRVRAYSPSFGHGDAAGFRCARQPSK
jgi:formylglycine-generating enzyme required for sulfatase activity